MEEEKDLIKIFTKEQLAKMLSDSWLHHNKLIKWLYDNYKSTLREWEATQGNLHIEFLDVKNNN